MADAARHVALRVIAGTLGGRRLEAPRGLATRPTSDRVREAMFMSLEPLDGLRVVDLYAGSGALGIEALSRGSAFVHFIEVAVDARRALEKNLERLELGERARVWRLRLPGGLGRIGGELGAADLVLADPPYGGTAAALIPLLGAPGRLKPGARVVIEHHAKDELPARSGTLSRLRERRYGETVVTTYRSEPEGATGSAGETGP